MPPRRTPTAEIIPAVLSHSAAKRLFEFVRVKADPPRQPISAMLTQCQTLEVAPGLRHLQRDRCSQFEGGSFPLGMFWKHTRNYAV